jgi:hypothetical protein
MPAPRQNRSSSRRLPSRVVQAGVGAAALAMTVTVTPTPTAQAATPRMIVGAVGDAKGLSNALGAPMAYHAYAKITAGVPNAKMVNMVPTTSWRTVANAKAGSSTYANIVRWAKTIKGRSGKVLFAFHHEPEASTHTGLGSAADYIAAYRRVVTIFRQQGVSNVEYTWQMTSWAFATKSSDRRYAAKWYPGDAYVNNVGSDPYNWYNCGPGSGKWQELKAVADPSLRFAKAHGKKLVLAEYASQANSRRAQWLKNARSYFIANRATIRGVFYFQFRARVGCSWKLTSSADLSAMRTMAKDTTNFSAS